MKQEEVGNDHFLLLMLLKLSHLIKKGSSKGEYKGWSVRYCCMVVR